MQARRGRNRRRSRSPGCATTGHFLAHLIRPTTSYQPGIAALKAASTRIVVGAGIASTGQLANHAAAALAERPGTPPVQFPVTTAVFAALPAVRRLLNQELTRTIRVGRS
jgi:hypothetical protein